MALKDASQHLSWKHLKQKCQYHFELIQPLKATVAELRDNDDHYSAAYLMVAAEVLKNQNATMSELINEDLIMIDLPIKTFERAFIAVSRQTRKEIEESDNVRIKFTKESKQSIFIHEIERLKPKPEHITFADKVYSGPTVRADSKDNSINSEIQNTQQTQKVTIREGEEL